LWHETGISDKTIIDFYNFCREVCSVILEEHSEPIGGHEKVVEIDESKFGKRKYNRGKRVDGKWVFGGIERDSNPPKCFFVPVCDRSADTLVPLIKKWILPGTTIHSDCWRAYSSLTEQGYIHRTVNHSVEFLSESGTHTNTIESTWNALKKSLPRYGTTKDLYNSYFPEYCIRKKFLSAASDKFLEFLRLVAIVYKPPARSEQQPEPAEAAELLAAAALPTAAAAACQPIDTFASDVGNFDLQFHLSDSDSDEQFDTSADLFL